MYMHIIPPIQQVVQGVHPPLSTLLTLFVRLANSPMTLFPHKYHAGVRCLNWCPVTSTHFPVWLNGTLIINSRAWPIIPVVCSKGMLKKRFLCIEPQMLLTVVVGMLAFNLGPNIFQRAWHCQSGHLSASKRAAHGTPSSCCVLAYFQGPNTSIHIPSRA